ncbi:MAG TPA: 4-(cytidine 5'-diphospho)-2-C-methyl-D-erythritol kinase [Candidatus Limnocylindria bacterium]|nr:4-(cytidine 5'-diphospho)-2-C-methyl-D-erythritol kinase [Candidatus Limnocylindria bacterium]
MSRRVTVDAYAKVNLTLEVTGKRDDGYHELRSVFATIDLADRVRAGRARTLDVRVTPPLDVREDLTERAARAFARALGREPSASVRTRKRIPVAAGLGGGSSDAAATLRALAALWGVPPPDADLAASLGSDVPFFVSGAPVALVEGRGERVRPLREHPLWLVLVPPRGALATPAVFGVLERGEWSDGSRSAALARAFDDGSVTPALVRELARNDLAGAAERCAPALRDLRERATRRGIALHVSGSGPAMFAVGDDERDAIRIGRALRRDGMRVRVLRAATSFAR